MARVTRHIVTNRGCGVIPVRLLSQQLISHLGEPLKAPFDSLASPSNLRRVATTRPRLSANSEAPTLPIHLATTRLWYGICRINYASEASTLGRPSIGVTSPRVDMRTQAMKVSFVLPIVFLCAMASGQGKQRFSQSKPVQNTNDSTINDYNINVHISATHFRGCAYVNVGCHPGVYVDAILNGKKVELSGLVDKRQAFLIVPGDYRAMLPTKPHGNNSDGLFQSWNVLLPDKTTWECQISGLSE